MRETSHLANKPETILRFIKQRSFYCFVGGAAIGLIGGAAMQISNGYVLMSIVAITAGVPGGTSFLLYQGDFPGDRMEKLKTKILKLTGTFKERFFGEDLSGRWLNAPDYDPLSIYNTAGDEFVGLEVQGHMTQAELMSLCKPFVKRLPKGASLTFLRLAEPFSTPFLRTYRPALLEKNIMGVRYVVILKIPYLKVTGEDHKKLIDNIPSIFYRLSREDMADISERIVDPHKKRKSRETPSFEASFVTDGRYAYPYPNECYAAISVCELGTHFDESIQDLFKPAFGMNSIVSTTIIKEGVLADGLRNLYGSMREQNFIGFGKVSDKQIEASKKEQRDEEEGDYSTLKVYSQALVYGKQEDTNRCLRDIKEAEKIDEKVKPLLSPELGNIRAALRAVTPGGLETLPSRTLKVRSLTEAGFYLPSYAPPTMASVEHPLVLRTVHNTPAYINHAGLSASPLTLFVGKSGVGKSTAMCLTIRAHWLLEELQGRPIATIVGEVGSSMIFMLENGIADLAFNMERKDSEDFEPLPIHPLHAFLEKSEDDGVTDANKLLARETIAFFIGADTTHASVATVLDKAIWKMVDKETVYRISTFKKYMDISAGEYIDSAPGAAKDGLSRDWFEFSTRLAMFAKGGSYGRIFDPDTPARDSLKGVVNFYYNMDEEIFEIPDLARAYIGLCWSVARSIGRRFKSNNEEARDTLLIIDEFDRQSEHLGKMTLKNMKDQSRKYGLIPALGIQSFDYLTQPDSVKGSQNTIYEGVGNTFFYGVGQEDVYRKISAIFDEVHIPGSEPRGKLKRMIEVAQKIGKSREDERKQKGIKVRLGTERKERVHSVGYFDWSRTIEELYVDVERDFLWMITTHPGGRAIRNAVRKIEPNLIKASLLLAEHGPWPIPSETPSAEDIRAICEKISFAKED